MRRVSASASWFRTPSIPSRSPNRKWLAIITAACSAVGLPSPAKATPTVQTLSDSHGAYYLVNNSALQNFQLYTTGALAGKITAITYDGQQMVGGKDFYYDIQGSPNIYLGSAESYSVRNGSNFVDITAFHAATATEPLDVTWHWILKDGQSGFSTYLTYHHTTAMANWGSSENRLGAEFFNGNLFHYSSITDNFWGYQAAGDTDRQDGRFITGETSDMRGIPSEYIKNYETKYDWRSTYQQSNGVTGIFGAPNTTTSTKPLLANDYGAWTIENPTTYEGWNAGPTHPQTPVADGASIIPSPPGSHFGGPSMVYSGNVDKSYGPIFTYFNKGSDITSLRADATSYTTEDPNNAHNLNTFYDTLNLPNYATSTQRGTVIGKARTADGTDMSGATVVLSSFDPTAYASSPISQEYQRRAAGYNYWVTPNKDGTFSVPDVRPGTYRVTIIKPGYYREGTFDNITVAGNGATTNVGNLAWTPDISGTGTFQIGAFDRTAHEFRDGSNYNNWLTTFNVTKEFPSGVSYTVNPTNPFNDTANWSQNWPLYQENGTLDQFHVHFNLTALPAAGSTVTFTVAVAAEEFINSLGFQMNGASQIYASFDHTADNAPSTYRSGDTSSRVMYRKVNLTVGAGGSLSFAGAGYGSLKVGSNDLRLHIVGGNMQYDALRMDIQIPGTFSLSQWNGGSGNWSDVSQWGTQQYGYTNVNKGLATVNGLANPEYGNDSTTTFSDGAAPIAPINSGTGASALYYDAVLNGGTANLDTSVTVQKFSLLTGTLNVSAGTPTLTANDVVVLGGGTFNGAGSLSAHATTTVSFTNTISGGASVTSTGAVNWLDGGSVLLTGAGSKWTVPGMSYGPSGTTTSLTVATGATVAAGANAITAGPQSTTTVSGGTVTAASFSNAGTLISTGTITVTGAFTNSGNATVGTLNAGNVSNTGGTLILNGPSTYTGGTSIIGGVVQFTSAASIGGSGNNVFVGSGGAVNYAPDITNPALLSRISTSSTGALALTATDSATTLDFTTGALSSFGNMGIGAVGNVTYNGAYIPAGSGYRFGGGGGVLTYVPTIAGNASVTVGNTGSSGGVILNSGNAYTGVTTITGGTLSVSLLANGTFVSDIGTSTNAASNLMLNGGILQFIGAASSSDRLFTLAAAGGTLDASGTGALTLTNTGAITASGTGARSLTLNGTSTAINTLSAAIGDPSSGTTSLIKNGTGTWALGAGAKSYSGDTSVLGGKLQLLAGTGLPSGAGKGNLVIGTAGTLEMNGQPLTINGLSDGPAGPITTANPTGWASANGPGGGTINNAGATQTLSIGNNSVGATFSGIVSGAINLVKNGAATQIISGDSTYTGTTTINAGTLQVGIGGTPGSFGPGDGGFRGKLGVGTITIASAASLVYNRGYLTTSSNLITGAGSLKQIANAELVLGSANTYTGATIIGSGIANLGLGGATDGTGLAYTGDCSLNASVLNNGGSPSSIGSSTNAAGNLILDGGTLFYTGATANTDRLFTITQNGGAIYANGGLTFNNGGAIIFSGTGDRTFSLEGETTTACTFGNDIGDPSSGKTFLTKDRSNTWILAPTATLTYSGDTTMNMGVLKIGVANQLPFGTGKGNVAFATSTDFSSAYDPVLELNGFDLNINGLSGGLTTYGSVDNNVGSHTLTLGNNNATATFSGIITGGINLIKLGSGIQTFAGSSTYTGATTLRGGTINATVANGSVGSGIGASSNVAVNLVFDGGTLSSVGSTDRLFTITANGGAIDSSAVNTTSLSFTNTGAVVLNTAASNPTLTLTGTNTAANTLNPALGNPNGGTLSILKSGIGVWVFGSSNTNTYSGPTHISGGTLRAGAANAFSANSTIVIDGGAILDLNNQTAETIGALSGAGSVQNTGAAQTDSLTIGANNGSAVFSGAISSVATLNVTKSGSGTQVFTGANTYSGSITASAGTLTIDYSSSITSTTITSAAGAALNVNGSIPTTAAIISNGATNFGAKTTSGLLVRTIGGLSLTSTGIATLNSPTAHGNRMVLVTSALTFGGSTDHWQGRLDVTGNDMIVKDGVLADIDNQLRAGFNAHAGYWDGSSGIISTTAAGNGQFFTTLGYRAGGNMLDTVPTNTYDVLLKYTYYGDANLDGVLDGADYQQIDMGFGSGLSGWYNGDFNYDGIVNGSDFALIDNVYNQISATGAMPLALAAAPAAELAVSTNSVPETATFSMLSAGFAGVLLRRKARFASLA